MLSRSKFFYGFSFLLLAACCLAAPLPARAAEKNHTNSIGMEFALIPAGSFMMGSLMIGVDENFEDAEEDEVPMHKVTISKTFYLGKYEVTQEQWVAVMGENPSEFKGPANPVERVSWEDAQIFIRKLNDLEGHGRYRLPTEAEWEYAARAGGGAYSFGDDLAELERYAWYADNSGIETHPVGKKLPNAFGLHDMHGNVWEWVQDWYADNYYSYSASFDPAGPAAGPDRVVRGGSLASGAGNCRSANRAEAGPENRDFLLGFRLLLMPEE